MNADQGAVPEGLGVLGLDDARIERQSGTKPVVRTGEEDLAYLIWTSGTTGAPKVCFVRVGCARADGELRCVRVRVFRSSIRRRCRVWLCCRTRFQRDLSRSCA